MSVPSQLCLGLSILYRTTSFWALRTGSCSSLTPLFKEFSTLSYVSVGEAVNQNQLKMNQKKKKYFWNDNICPSLIFFLPFRNILQVCNQLPPTLVTRPVTWWWRMVLVKVSLPFDLCANALLALSRLIPTLALWGRRSFSHPQILSFLAVSPAGGACLW